MAQRVMVENTKLRGNLLQNGFNETVINYFIIGLGCGSLK